MRWIVAVGQQGRRRRPAMRSEDVKGEMVVRREEREEPTIDEVDEW